MALSTPIPVIEFPPGVRVPRLGLGTWRMGEARSARAAEVRALREGIDLGMTLIDTAEMYGEGGAEEVVAEAIADCRDRVFIVSKFYPHHASREELARACEASLRRLRVDRLDIYLLHWRGDVPLSETVEGLERLVESGKISRWGVSNFDVADLAELERAGGTGKIATNQVLYNLSRRGVEWDLLHWCGARSIPVMAYSPVDQGRLARAAQLETIARRVGASTSQVAIAWLLSRPGIVAIPKATSVEHVRENRRAAQLVLDTAALTALDAAFPAPRRKSPLEMI
jgi:diketogulonate reductase-like aldo/keto reductase